LPLISAREASTAQANGCMFVFVKSFLPVAL